MSQVLVSEKFHEQLELAWKETFFSLMRPSVKEELIDNESIRFSEKWDIFLRSHYKNVLNKTLVDPFRLGLLLDLAYYASKLPGDFVECGSYKGGSGVLMAQLLNELGVKKLVHLCDSFEGLPEPNQTMDKGYKQGDFKSDYDEIVQLIADLKLSNNIRLHKGWFNETLPALKKENKEISLLHIDCDLYNSTLDCMNNLFEGVVEGGVVVLDDFNDGGKGEKKAVLEHLKDLNFFPLIYVGPAPQAYFFKDTQRKAKHFIKDGMFTYCLDTLDSFSSYTKWLNSELGSDYLTDLRRIEME